MEHERAHMGQVVPTAAFIDASTPSEIREAIRWYQAHRSGELLRLAKIGERVVAGARKARTRPRELDAVIVRTFRSLRTAQRSVPSARKVWSYLQAHDRDNLIQHVTETHLCWADERGRPHSMSFGRFRNKLSALRASLHE
jgi:hypothetical protein